MALTFHFSGILGDQFSLTSSGDNGGRLRAYTVLVAHHLQGVAAVLVILAACGAGDTENPALAAGPTSQRAAPAAWPPTHEPDGRERERHQMVESQSSGAASRTSRC